MKASWKLGRLFGIEIKMHWTFLILIGWVAIANIRAGNSTELIFMNIAIIVVVFACVVLHELGHALMARYFGIGTKKITLLPIGGIAHLERNPEKPKEELLVALAGPFVNFLIVVVLLLFVPISSYSRLSQEEIETMINLPTAANFLLYILMANAILLLFNMIPAFPMDGGRVVRAMLAFFRTRQQATAIAVGLGQFISVIFFVFGVLYNPFLAIIAVFVFFGATSELEREKMTNTLRGNTVIDALLTDITLLKSDQYLYEVIDLIISGTERDFIVIDAYHKPVGVLPMNIIIKNAKKENLTVGEIMLTEFKIISPDMKLPHFLDLLSNSKQSFYPVVENEKIVGAIDMKNITEFITLKQALYSPTLSNS
ncbi:site-2 protease family protein [Spongiivirga sp. MCCC 1A20706]|uniref:site-2 protease family protein n=1 Tax=Spongiivirga sp. MCCC 1A20706 TaxID=3160963 RepID=UPI00397744A2